MSRIHVPQEVLSPRVLIWSLQILMMLMRCHSYVFSDKIFLHWTLSIKLIVVNCNVYWWLVDHETFRETRWHLYFDEDTNWKLEECWFVEIISSAAVLFWHLSRTQQSYHSAFFLQYPWTCACNSFLVFCLHPSRFWRDFTRKCLS